MPDLSINKYHSDQFHDWDDFVCCSINGTIFHERKFISYHPEDRFTDHSLMIYNKNKLIAVFPAAEISKNDQKILKSHPGTSYGGLVFKERSSLKETFEIIKAIDSYSKEQGFDIIEFREAPKIFNQYPIDQFDFSLIKNNYIRESEELSTCYYLPDFMGLTDQELLEKFDNHSLTKTRQGIKKAIKDGCEFVELKSSEIDEFHDLLSENLKKHNTKPVHSKDEILKLLSLYPDRVKLYGVRFNGKLISAMMLLNINHTGWHIFYSALDYELKHHRPVHFQIFNLIKILSSNYTFLNYGISTEDGGNIINWALFRFKESFHGHGIIRTYWQKHLNEKN